MNATATIGVTINATAETVWEFMSASEKVLAWMTFIPGAPTASVSKFDVRPGGEVVIKFPNGGAAKGSVVEVEPKKRLVFTWGYEPDVGKTGMRPGSTRVEMSIAESRDGTRVTLVHSGAMSGEIAKGHEAGWRHYLSQLALQSAMAQTQRVLGDVLESYFAACNEADEKKRNALLEKCCEEDVRVLTPFACGSTREEFGANIANGLKHMPGCVSAQSGLVNHIHGTARVPWTVRSGDGKKLFSGENIVTLSARGKIEKIVSFHG